MDQIRIYIWTDRVATRKNLKPRKRGGNTVKIEVTDVERLHWHWSEGKWQDEL
ncbi:MAG: hypothetical protein M3Y57_08275 [Acidobacteriota bacterium]|nr:hypothetical protein [Acidobacteriota bacterium]